MPLIGLSGDQALWAVAILSLAFFVRGIAGFGSGLIAIPLLALFLPLPVVVPLMALLDYLAAATHGIHHRESIQWRDLWPLLPFTLAGSLSALYLLHHTDTEYLKAWLGGFVLLYAVYSLSGIAPHHQRSRRWAVPGGALGGLVGTLFGTGGPFYVIYLHLRALGKQEFRATVAAIFLIDGAIRLTGYAATGLVDRHVLWLMLGGLPVMFGAMYLGGHIHTTISQRNFTRLIGLLLMGSGVALLVR